MRCYPIGSVYNSDRKIYFALATSPHRKADPVGGHSPARAESLVKSLWSVVTTLCLWYGASSAPALAQPGAGSGLASTETNTVLAAEIDNAAADRLYAIQMTFAPRTSIGKLRAVATELDIPRVLAIVEYDVRGRAAQPGSVMLALGRSYDGNTAGRHSECQALLQLRSTASPLGDEPIDEWPVGRLHLSATAHAIRDLLRGIRLANATLVSGTAAPPEHLRTIDRAARSATSQPIPNPGGIDLPPYCGPFVVEANEAHLAGGFPRYFELPAATPGESFRDTAFRVLAALPPNMAVTIDLELNPRMEVEELATLVRDYRIRGMRAELSPERSIRPMVVEAELSTHGDLSAQVHRARCTIRSTEQRGHAAGAWRSARINVSLSADDAARFLGRQNLAQATVSGAAPIAALDRLASYYQGRPSQIYELPRSWPIPEGCSNVYVHGDFDDEGSVRGLEPGPVEPEGNQ